MRYVQPRGETARLLCGGALSIADCAGPLKEVFTLRCWDYRLEALPADRNASSTSHYPACRDYRSPELGARLL